MIKFLKLSHEKFFLITFFIVGVFYVCNCWSPSSYGVFLKQFDPYNTGLIWGTPRDIRSDEWGVVTPLIQATVNNKYERYNKTSFYDEDLRINYALPIHDWGLIFKPTMLGYTFLTPAHAYSLQWYLVFFIFIFGYFKLLKRIGMPAVVSLSLAFTLYFSGFSQFWWDEKGPLFSFFPWIVLILLSKLSVPKKTFIYYWLATSWMITDFYPPIIISLGFVGALIYLAYEKNILDAKKIIALIISTACAVATALFYLKDYLLKTMDTLYPGHRAAGGGSVSIYEWLSQFLPFSTFNNNFDVFTASNICEIGAVGLPFILMLLFMIDYKKLNVKHLNFVMNKKGVVLISGLILMNVWMLVPLPAWSGKIFLWDNVQPSRMKYAEGFLLSITFLLAVREIPLVVSWRRFILYSVLILVGWWLTKGLYTNWFNSSISSVDVGFRNNYLDLIFIIAMFCTTLAVNYLKCDALEAVMVTSTFLLAIVMCQFNPVQSSETIFSNHTNIKANLDPLVNTKNGTLAVKGYFGATLNGLGYKSVTHVTAVPAMDVWKKYFPELDENKFNSVFNRYSHIRLADVAEPKLVWADAIEVPVNIFSNELYFPVTIDESSHIPFSINKNEALTGFFKSVHGGKLKTLSIMIGTYSGLSTGNIMLTLCNGGVCENASTTLQNAADNSYLPLVFNTPLVINSSELTYYTLKISGDATYPTAIWLYKDKDNINVFTGHYNSVISGLTPRIKLKYEAN